MSEELRDAVDALVRASGLTGTAARELEADLTEHVREGLAAGHTPAEVVDLLGDPDSAGPLLAAGRPTQPRRPDPDNVEGLLSSIRADLLHTVRTLRRSAGLTATATIVLGLGIAATAVAFTVVNEIFLRPLPVEDQSQLVDIWARVPGGNSFAGFGWHDVREYQETAGPEAPLTEVAAFAGARVSLGQGAGRRTAIAQLVSESYFPMLGVRAGLGQVTLQESPGFSGPRTAVLSDALWRDAYAADPAVVGRTIFLQDEAFTVVGVAAPGFRGHFIGFPVDLWIPITTADLVLPGFDVEDRARMPFEMIGRRAEGVSVSDAVESLEVVARDLQARYPDTHRGHLVGVTPTSGVDHSLQPIVVTFVAVISVLASLVLLIACLNVSALLLVRTIAREGELAVRLALGAGRARLVRQLLTEAMVLTSLGAVAGILLSRVLSGRVDSLFRQLAPGLGLEMPFDGRVLGLTVVFASVAALVAGSAPAWHVLHRAPASVLRGRSSPASGARGRSALVVVQVAVSVALVITTGLFLRALNHGATVDPGFAADELATFILPDDPDGASLEPILTELRAVPGVLGVAVADGPPTGVARTPLRITLPGIEPPPGEEEWIVDARRVGADYLTTVGVRLLQGRDFSASDERDSPPVAVVNQAFADRFWPAEAVLGRSIEIDGQPVAVAGIAGNSRTLIQDDTPDPFVYVSFAGTEPQLSVIALRSTSPDQLGDPVRAIIGRARPGDTPPTPSLTREALDAGLLAQRLGAAIVGAISAVALILALVGLYGLVQYTVSRDRHQLAVRLALGGSRTGVLGTALRKGMTLVGAGTLAGVLLAGAGAPALSVFLLGIDPRDIVTYAVVTLLFGTMALVACAVPARRAMSIPPAAALRGE